MNRFNKFYGNEIASDVLFSLDSLCFLFVVVAITVSKDGMIFADIQQVNGRIREKW